MIHECSFELPHPPGCYTGTFDSGIVTGGGDPFFGFPAFPYTTQLLNDTATITRYAPGPIPPYVPGEMFSNDLYIYAPSDFEYTVTISGVASAFAFNDSAAIQIYAKDMNGTVSLVVPPLPLPDLSSFVDTPFEVAGQFTTDDFTTEFYPMRLYFALSSPEVIQTSISAGATLEICEQYL
jgi:hypothetical protein